MYIYRLWICIRNIAPDWGRFNPDYAFGQFHSRQLGNKGIFEGGAGKFTACSFEVAYLFSCWVIDIVHAQYRGIHRDVYVFGEPANEFPSFAQRGTAFKHQVFSKWGLK